MKLMVYSHDAFGLGNIRRIMAICQYLLKAFPEISILVVSGSPALHRLRLPVGLDYIKLPCLSRDEGGTVAAKYLQTEVAATVRLRSQLILVAAANFQPDLLLVDKKPTGLKGELQPTLRYLKQRQTRSVLLLRDILDAPAATIQNWQANNYYSLAECWYDQVWVVGSRHIFDTCDAYQFPTALARKVRFCGYIQRQLGALSSQQVRQQLRVAPSEKLVLVTPGGGEDGYRLIQTYLDGLAQLQTVDFKSLVILGPEMPTAAREHLQAARLALPHPVAQVQLIDFSDSLTSYLAAADVVVSMAGYNTVNEILALRKRSVVVPRIQPVQEQLIRAQRWSQLGLLKAIHPDQLTPASLMAALQHELNHPEPLSPLIDLNALPRIAHYLSRLLQIEAPALDFLSQPSRQKCHA
ncbi:MAG: glycosyltransferase [Leptolyngbya sp. SIO4C1]|nr:glycosyltransferase [Leptolyngbya sp. SIO4C1]